MSPLTTESKIQKFIEETIMVQLSTWSELLVSGDLYGYEREALSRIHELYNHISESLLPTVALQIGDQLGAACREAGGRKIEVRPLKLRIATGRQIEVQSPYVKQVGEEWHGPRQLLSGHWKLIGGASPALYDRVGFCAALGPSYDTAQQTLDKFGVEVSLSSVRDITNRLANHCFESGEEELIASPGETLEGKRVVISVDGGRTRTRSYDGKENDSGNATYQTAWCEPKLFVIDVFDDKGQPSRQELPIYGCRFSEADMLALLERYLKRLHIAKVRQVQIIADGAPWIWNHLKQMLLNLAVPEACIVETLDYYHASQYVHGLVEKMPKRVSTAERKAYLQQFKSWLWNGEAARIIETCHAVFKRPGKIVNRWLNYLEKHQHRTRYAQFEKAKLMCGSGIIESAIRRVINLRFKNASTFWEKRLVEKLYFLRAALLSKRWAIVMANLTG